MEVNTYFKIIVRYWWVVLLVTVVAGGAASALSLLRAPVYSTHARVVARPSPVITDTRTIADLMGQMGSRSIVGTYAQLFTSEEVKTDARQGAGLSADAASDYDLEANVLPDTVVIEVSGSGPNPLILSNYLNATVDAAVARSGSIFGVVDLKPLEVARVPRTPSSPQPSRDIPLGLGLGLGLGILLALALDYLRGRGGQASEGHPPQERPRSLTRIG